MKRSFPLRHSILITGRSSLLLDDHTMLQPFHDDLKTHGCQNIHTSVCSASHMHAQTGWITVSVPNMLKLLLSEHVSSQLNLCLEMTT